MILGRGVAAGSTGLCLWAHSPATRTGQAPLGGFGDQSPAVHNPSPTRYFLPRRRLLSRGHCLPSPQDFFEIVSLLGDMSQSSQPKAHSLHSVPRLSLSPHSQMSEMGKECLCCHYAVVGPRRSHSLTLGLNVPSKIWRVSVPPRISSPKAPLLILPHSISKELGFTGSAPPTVTTRKRRRGAHTPQLLTAEPALPCQLSTPSHKDWTSSSGWMPEVVVPLQHPHPRILILRLEIPALVLWL